MPRLAGASAFADIETVFLDVGNTLISIDFDWVAAELGARGVYALLLDPYDDWHDLDCPVACHLMEVADAMAATRS